MLSYLQSFHVDSRHEDLEMYTFDRIVGQRNNKHVCLNDPKHYNFTIIVQQVAQVFHKKIQSSQHARTMQQYFDY